MKIRIKRFNKTLPLPEAEPDAAGFDLFCRETVTIKPRSVALVPVNNAIAVPKNHFLLLAVRSSTPLKKGLMLANGIGIVDPFYCGDKDEIKVQLFNYTDAPVAVREGEALTQGLLVKHEAVEWEEVQSLGTDGHGGYWV